MDFETSYPSDARIYHERVERLFEMYGDAERAVDHLQRESVSSEPGVREHSAGLLTQLIDRATAGFGADRAAPSDRVWQSEWGMGSMPARLDEWLLEIGRRLQWSDASERVRWAAATAWLAVALAAGAMIITGRLWWAALLIVGRIVGSLWIGSSDLPEPGDRIDTGEVAAGRMQRCVMSHAGHAAVLLGVAGALAGAQRVVWSTATMVSLCIMSFATLLRVGALQAGVLARRSALEHVARHVTVIAAVVGAAAFQPWVPTRGVPLLAFAGAGSFVFGILELFQIRRMLARGNGVVVIQRRPDNPPVVVHQSISGWGSVAHPRAGAGVGRAGGEHSYTGS